MQVKELTKDQAIPETASVSVANVGVHDVVVVRCEEHISQQAARGIQALVQERFPDRKVLVLPKDLTLEIVRQAPSALVPGDKMRASLPFLKEIHEHGSGVVRVVRIDEEQDGTKTLVMEQV